MATPSPITHLHTRSQLHMAMITSRGNPCNATEGPWPPCVTDNCSGQRWWRLCHGSYSKISSWRSMGLSHRGQVFLRSSHAYMHCMWNACPQRVKILGLSARQEQDSAIESLVTQCLGVTGLQQMVKVCLERAASQPAKRLCNSCRGSMELHCVLPVASNASMQARCCQRCGGTLAIVTDTSSATIFVGEQELRVGAAPMKAQARDLPLATLRQCLALDYIRFLQVFCATAVALTVSVNL